MYLKVFLGEKCYYYEVVFNNTDKMSYPVSFFIYDGSECTSFCPPSNLLLRTNSPFVHRLLSGWFNQLSGWRCASVAALILFTVVFKVLMLLYLLHLLSSQMLVDQNKGQLCCASSRTTLRSSWLSFITDFFFFFSLFVVLSLLNNKKTCMVTSQTNYKND